MAPTPPKAQLEAPAAEREVAGTASGAGGPTDCGHLLPSAGGSAKQAQQGGPKERRSGRRPLGPLGQVTNSAAAGVGAARVQRAR